MCYRVEEFSETTDMCAQVEKSEIFQPRVCTLQRKHRRLGKGMSGFRDRLHFAAQTSQAGRMTSVDISVVSASSA